MLSQFDYPFQPFVPMERCFSNVGPSRVLAVPMRHNFLAFLATAQALDIDTLPITWQSAREPIGQGGTSRINQAPANIHMSLAFKQIKDKEKLEKTEAEIFHMVINELLVLGHPPIQEHPNIVRLQGICWDISSDGKVWPVLVFEKSQFDDLYSFATRPIGKELGIRHRLKLCVDIGEAIIYMYSHNIVHGDVKPENVLTFRDHDGMYTARLTDFGYSTRYASDADLITMAISWPWNAPEHNRGSKMWTTSEAKKIDLFSFGMLCLWILFEKVLSAPESSVRKAAFWGVHEVPCSSPWQSREILHISKVEKKLPLLALWLLEAETDLNDDERGALKEFFSSVLDEAQDRRDISAGNLFKRNHGTEQFIASSQLEEKGLNVSDSDFKIENNIFELYRSDYRVRLYIVKCLEETLSSASASPTTNFVENIAFQVALCYEIGFGVKRNKEKSMKALQESKHDKIDIEEIMGQLKRTKRNGKLLQSEYLPYTDNHLYYSEKGILGQAEQQAFQEIEDIQQSLGAENDVALVLKSALSTLLSDQGRFEEAEELQQQSVELSKKSLGAEHQNTLIEIADLADIIRDRGQWRKAGRLHQQIFIISKRTLGAEHPTTLMGMVNCASMYAELGREDAEELAQQALEISKRTLGAEHPDTLFTMTELTSIFGHQERWEEAEELQQQTIEISTKTLGAEHPATLNGMANLARIFSGQGRRKEAERRQQKVVEISKRTLGAEHPNTLNGLDHLASLYRDSGEAEKLQQQVVEISKRIHGVEHPVTQDRMTNLARIYNDQERWEESEKLRQQIVEARRNALEVEQRFWEQESKRQEPLDKLKYGYTSWEEYHESLNELYGKDRDLMTVSQARVPKRRYSTFDEIVVGGNHHIDLIFDPSWTNELRGSE